MSAKIEATSCTKNVSLIVVKNRKFILEEAGIRLEYFLLAYNLFSFGRFKLLKMLQVSLHHKL